MQTGSISLIDSSELLHSGPPANPMSPIETTPPVAIEEVWDETSRLADLITEYSRATIAAKTLCGIHLRSIRTHYFGERNPNGGRPKKTSKVGPFSTWDDMLKAKTPISPSTADNWMKMADAVEAIALAEGTDIQSICKKLPHDWTPEEVRFIDNTTKRITQDKTQRELLQSDFLSGLGYEEPKRINGSNNPFGKNGGKKTPPASIEEFVRLRQEAARLTLFGSPEYNTVKPGSPASFIHRMLQSKGAELEALSKKELQDFYDLDVIPFADLIRDLIRTAGH